MTCVDYENRMGDDGDLLFSMYGIVFFEPSCCDERSWHYCLTTLTEMFSRLEKIVREDGVSAGIYVILCHDSLPN